MEKKRNSNKAYWSTYLPPGLPQTFNFDMFGHEQMFSE